MTVFEDFAVPVREYKVTLGGVSDLIDALDEGEAQMAFIEKHGIDQSEHDSIEVQEHERL